jgi:predicted component of type VI protein secretion system
MENNFYTLPLALSDIIKKQRHKLCSLNESIAQNIYLLITTHFKEFRYDHTYGCSVWENDFEILPNMMWKDDIKASIEKILGKHEKRLTNVKVKVDIEEFEFQNKENIRIKKKLGIKIEGTTMKTNEKFEFLEYIFISPFSLE